MSKVRRGERNGGREEQQWCACSSSGARCRLPARVCMHVARRRRSSSKKKNKKSLLLYTSHYYRCVLVMLHRYI
jgi:hypothetical protein